MSATFGKIPQVIMHDVCHDGRSNVNAENGFVSLPNGIPPCLNVFIDTGSLPGFLHCIAKGSIFVIECMYASIFTPHDVLGTHFHVRAMRVLGSRRARQ